MLVDGRHQILNLFRLPLLDDFTDKFPNLNVFGSVIRGYCWDSVDVGRVVWDIPGIIVSCSKRFPFSIHLFLLLRVILSVGSSLLVALLHRSESSEVPAYYWFHGTQSHLDLLFSLSFFLLQLHFKLLIKIFVKPHILSRLNLFLNLVNFRLGESRSIRLVFTFEVLDRF